MSDDPALDSLWLPFDSGALPWPARSPVLFLRARAVASLPVFQREQLRCEQSFRPMADALQRQGYVMAADDAAQYALTLVLPPRQRDEARALFAAALRRTEVDGIVLSSQANNEGARSGENDLRDLLGDVSSLSKNHCRVYWARATASAKDSELARQWSALDAARPIGDGRFQSRPGVFSWDRIDAGSALLAECLPSGLTGRAADLGAGWGYLSAQLLARNPGIVALDLYEAEARALALAESNLATEGSRVDIAFHWHDVARGLSSKYDVIISNPPFHVGRADLPELGRAFIAAAALALNPGGRFWMVANRHLAYEQAMARHFSGIRTLVVRDGFKVIEASGARA